MNKVVESMVNEWPGEVTIVNGRPRNPKCQGLVEQGNHMVEKLWECESMSMMRVITHLGLNGSLSYSVSILLFVVDAKTNGFCNIQCYFEIIPILLRSAEHNCSWCHESYPL